MDRVLYSKHCLVIYLYSTQLTCLDQCIGLLIRRWEVLCRYAHLSFYDGKLYIPSTTIHIQVHVLNSGRKPVYLWACISLYNDIRPTLFTYLGSSTEFVFGITSVYLYIFRSLYISHRFDLTGSRTPDLPHVNSALYRFGQGAWQQQQHLRSYQNEEVRVTYSTLSRNTYSPIILGVQTSQATDSMIQYPMQ